MWSFSAIMPAEVPVRNVVFVAPFPMPATLRFAAGIRSLKDVRLIGLVQALTQTLGKIHHVACILEKLPEPLVVARHPLGPLRRRPPVRWPLGA